MTTIWRKLSEKQGVYLVFVMFVFLVLNFSDLSIHDRTDICFTSRFYFIFHIVFAVVLALFICHCTYLHFLLAVLSWISTFQYDNIPFEKKNLLNLLN